MDRDLTPEEAFGSVIRAWEFATIRPAMSAMPSPVPDIAQVTVGAHWIASEPLQWPIPQDDLLAIRAGDQAPARKALKQAEAFWLSLSENAPFAGGWPAHRFPRTPSIELDTSMLIGRITQSLLETPPADLPDYTPVESPLTDWLPDPLKGVICSTE